MPGWPRSSTTWGSTARRARRAVPLRPRSCAEPDWSSSVPSTWRRPRRPCSAGSASCACAPYSYDLLDNGGRRSPQALTPGLEQLSVGQRMMRIFKLVGFEPGRSITVLSEGRLFGRVAVTYRVERNRCGTARGSWSQGAGRHARGGSSGARALRLVLRARGPRDDAPSADEPRGASRRQGRRASGRRRLAWPRARHPSPPCTAAAQDRRCCCLHGFTDTWRTWELVLALARAPATRCSRRPSPATPAARRSAASRSTRGCCWTSSSATMDEAGLRTTVHIVGNSPRWLPGAAPGRTRPRSRASWRWPRPAAGPEGDERLRGHDGQVLHINARAAAAWRRRRSRSCCRQRRTGDAGRRLRNLRRTTEHIPAELLAHQLHGVAGCSGAPTLIASALSDGW